jgi:hypothetical protein
LILWFWSTHFGVQISKGNHYKVSEEFRENFQNKLENWEYDGKWETRKDGENTILVVTDSSYGGIAKPCLLWRNYIFEFETKIVNKNTTWVIRAKDARNYVMFQCQSDKIYPHFLQASKWKNLDWTKQNPILLERSLPFGTWIKVIIEVRASEIKITLNVNGVEMQVLNSDHLLTSPIAPQTYDVGSVGFRASSNECAHFRNISVKELK